MAPDPAVKGKLLQMQIALLKWKTNISNKCLQVNETLKLTWNQQDRIPMISLHIEKKSHTIFVKWTIALQWLLEFHVYNSIGFYKINFFVYSRKVETCFCLYEWKNETSRRHGQSIEIGEGYGSNEIKIISHHDAQSSTR